MRRTVLTEQEYLNAKGVVLQHLTGNASVQNRDVRALTDLNYDQAIRFFERMLLEGTLRKFGKGSATHYVRADS